MRVVPTASPAILDYEHLIESMSKLCFRKQISWESIACLTLLFLCSELIYRNYLCARLEKKLIQIEKLYLYYVYGQYGDQNSHVQPMQFLLRGQLSSVCGNFCLFIQNVKGQRGWTRGLGTQSLASVTTNQVPRNQSDPVVPLCTLFGHGGVKTYTGKDREETFH